MAGMLRLFGWIVAFLAVAAVVLFGIVLVLRTRAPDDDALLLVVILGALLVTVGGFVPFLNRAMRRSLVFPARAATPLPEAELRARLRALTGRGPPLELLEDGRTLRLRWRYLDAGLRGVLERQQLSSACELRIRLDPARQEAVLTDIRRSLRMRAGASGVRLGAGFTRGYLVGVEVGRGYDIDSDLAVRPAFDYSFSPATLKRPVLHTLAEAGWTARFAMW